MAKSIRSAGWPAGPRLGGRPATGGQGDHPEFARNLGLSRGKFLGLAERGVGFSAPAERKKGEADTALRIDDVRLKL